MPVYRQYIEEIPSFLRNIIENPKKFLKRGATSPFSVEQIGQLHDCIIKQYSQIPNLIYLKDYSPHFENVEIIGDTHGDLHSTLRIIKPFLRLQVDSLIFLGDYVDRGIYSLENFVLLLAMSLAWPKRVILLRGNHEEIEVNQYFGFYDELQEYYPEKDDFEKIIQYLDNIYNHLSLVAITPRNSVCMHAGLPKKLKEIKKIKQIPKPHINITKIKNKREQKRIFEIFTQIQWNDPIEKKLDNPQEKSYHGYYYFTEDEVIEFLEHNQLERIIRAHEAQRGGFDKVFNGHLLHIMSTEPYYGQVERACIIHEDPSGNTFVKDLDFKFVKKIDRMEDVEKILHKIEKVSNS